MVMQSHKNSSCNVIRKTFFFCCFKTTDAVTYMRGSSAAGKSERIKTHQRSLYTQIQKNMLQIPEAPTRSTLGPTLVLTPSWLSIMRPTPSQSMMRCPRRPMGPHPPRYYVPLQVDSLS
ncbi:hypothetical protein M9H77_31236 [Catharanthus roseus]|uniref:Uncharacterized protein n=1 Tax=Catharanthus roseus TaxID=4058 RepID=A0ACC0A0B8_CATRO|nr:hypothetical protein M9H77_31236 [Catharanthus roseus]